MVMSWSHLGQYSMYFKSRIFGSRISLAFRIFIIQKGISEKKKLEKSPPPDLFQTSTISQIPILNEKKKKISAKSQAPISSLLAYICIVYKMQIFLHKFFVTFLIDRTFLKFYGNQSSSSRIISMNFVQGHRCILRIAAAC